MPQADSASCARIDITDNEETTLLHKASFNGHHQVVSELLKPGVPVDPTDAHGVTPLHFASERGHLRCCEAPLEWQANVSARDLDGASPLHLACINGHTQVVALLLKGKADINAMGTPRTMRMCACLTGLGRSGRQDNGGDPG